MAGPSNIQWTEQTWNPIVGCSIVSPGCKNCYAMRDAWRKQHHPRLGRYHGLTETVNGHPVWTGEVRLAPSATLLAPLRRKKPTTYFVNSMGDLFHESIPDEWIDQVFAIVAQAQQHTYQILTKRGDRMRRFMQHANWRALGFSAWPPRCVWLGVSVERQKEAEERILQLLETLAAVRFVSGEPLLAPIDLTKLSAIALGCRVRPLPPVVDRDGQGPHVGPHLDWVIVGGESGPNARPFNIEWADQIIAQCKAAGVPCFVKQLGSAPLSDGYPLHLKDRKGGTPEEWPERLRVREMPRVAA